MGKAIVVVLLSLALCAPALAALSNGFNSDYCYALQGTNVSIYDQATGAKMSTLTGLNGETLTFSGSATPGQNSPAGARLFTAAAFDRSGDGRTDDIRIQEWNSAGQQIRQTYLYTAVGGYLAPNLSYGLALGSLRYNPVNKTLVVSANVSNNNPTIQNSKAWEIALPDWAEDPNAQTAALVNTYTLLKNKQNRTNIDIAPDGKMYATGYRYGLTDSNRSSISVTSTNPLDPNFGVNTLVLDGAAYFAATNDTQHNQMSAIVWRETDRLGDGVMVPELNTSNEATTTSFQPYAWDWVGPWFGGGPYGQVGRQGTPGDDIAPLNNRVRGIRAQRDPLTGEAFIVGNQAGYNRAGVLQLRATGPRNTGSLVFDQDVATADAASPIPEPAMLVLLGLGGLVGLRQRRR
jgi:MYXO-CTERM domain-containing protein